MDESKKACETWSQKERIWSFFSFDFLLDSENVIVKKMINPILLWIKLYI